MEAIGLLYLPVGFKFQPSDEQLVGYYLFNKISGNPIPYIDQIIRDIDLYDTKEPWEIWESFGGLTLEGDEDLYFFTQLKKKGVNGSRIDRKVGSGAWQGEDSANDVRSRKYNRVIGSKKRFRYENNKHSKQHGCWIMHEYSLDSCLFPRNHHNQYVLCRIRKNDQAAVGGKKRSRKKRKSDEQVKGNLGLVEDHQYKQQFTPSKLPQTRRILTTQHKTTRDQIDELSENQQCLTPHTPSGFEENRQLHITEQSFHLQQPELPEFEENQQLPITEKSLVQQPKFSELHTPCGFEENQQLPSTVQSLSLLDHDPELSENHHCYMLRMSSGFEDNQLLPTTEQSLIHQPEISELHSASGFEENQQLPSTEQSLGLLNHKLELSEYHLHTASGPLLENNQPLSNKQESRSLSPHQPEPEYGKQNQRLPAAATSDDGIFSQIDFSEEFPSACTWGLASALEPPDFFDFVECLTDCCYLDC
ncbi:putative NAC domain-containing protein [Melia azedarach]|uniref:NAC domain-containing protein n=1 Tax=Melia azedarach TaxID=155640 RepID=A0ACC1X662_MELAZ|nr:putative NAC domain-containing protein [Melia azedarach]